MKKGDWIASQYMDTEEWGVLDDHGVIIVRISWGLTEEQCSDIAALHNTQIDVFRRPGSQSDG